MWHNIRFYLQFVLLLFTKDVSTSLYKFRKVSTPLIYWHINATLEYPKIVGHI